MEKIKKYSKLIRYIFAYVFILGGIFEIKTGLIIEGIFYIIFGITLMPIIYEKLNLTKYKKIEIIVPAVCFALIMVFSPQQENTIETYSNEIINAKNNEMQDQNTLNNSLDTKINQIEIKDIDINLNLDENKSVEITITPNDSTNKDKLNFISEDNTILDFIKDGEKSTGTTIYGKITAKKEGKTNIYVQTDDGIKSNIVEVEIIKKQEQSVSTTNNTGTEAASSSKSDSNIGTSSKSSSTSTTTQSVTSSTVTPKSTGTTSTNKDNSKTVYITPTGKRYHLDPDCGGVNSRSTTLSDALSRGLTPCMKCAQ